MFVKYYLSILDFGENAAKVSSVNSEEEALKNNCAVVQKDFGELNKLESNPGMLASFC